MAGFSLPRDHGVGFTDSTTFVAVSLQAFVGDFRPKLFEFRRRRLVRVPFGFIRSPGHFFSSYVGTYAISLSLT